MPSYSYTCRQCGHTQAHILPMAERQIPETEPCPGCLNVDCVKQDICAPFLGDPVNQGVTKAPSEFRNDVLKPAMSAYNHTQKGQKLKELYRYAGK
jgi:hypothetical protein